MEKKRYFGLDCVRILALCLLLWLHYLLRNGFYNKPVDTIPMMIAAGGRHLFMCCIPLFLMLTGYLKCQKPWKKGYYRSLGPILISWIIVTVLCLFYKIYVDKDEMTVYAWICDILNFSTANYSWYIEMYIGLLLMSPLFNAGWEALGTKKARLCLVLSFVFLTMLPKTVNIIKLDGENTLNLIPNYWSGLWPITYYLIGCYIKTYQPKVKKLAAFMGAVAFALICGVINRYTGGEAGKFSKGFNMTYSHLGCAFMSILMFLSLYQLECRKKTVCRIAGFISGITLEMYLVSCLFDQKIYSYQKGKYPPSEYGIRGFLSTASVFVLSMLAGYLIHKISVWIFQVIEGKMKRKSKIEKTMTEA